jgi:flavin reductase (DIM6/NTAB) family NADH-FMN oxidoreductase RutF
LRRVYECLPTCVAAVCALSDGAPVGIAASAFTTVSVAPPLVSVCVQNSSSTWPKLRRLARLGVSVLAKDQHRECETLAMKEGDRFAGVRWDATSGGALFIRGASAWLDCSPYREMDAGDHAVALLRIHGFRAGLDHTGWSYTPAGSGSWRIRSAPAVRGPRGNHKPARRSGSPALAGDRLLWTPLD